MLTAAVLLVMIFCMHSLGAVAPAMSLMCTHSAVARNTRTSVVGLSCASVWMLPSRFTTLIPEHTRPKMVCLPSSQGVGANVMKNCIKQDVYDVMFMIC